MQVHHVVEKRMMFDHADDKILKSLRNVPTPLQAFIGGWPMRGGNKAIPPATREKFTRKEVIKVNKKTRKWGAARWRLLKDAMTRPRRFMNFLKRKYCADDSGDEFDADESYTDTEVEVILEFFRQFGLGYSDLPDLNTFAPELRGLLASRPKKPKGKGPQFEGNLRRNLKKDKEKERKKKKKFANPLWDEEAEEKEAAEEADQLVQDWPHVWDISATQRWLSKMMQGEKKGKGFFRHWPIGMRCSLLLCQLVPLKEPLKLQCSEVWLCFFARGAKVQRKLNDTNQIQWTFCRSIGQFRCFFLHFQILTQVPSPSPVPESWDSFLSSLPPDSFAALPLCFYRCRSSSCLPVSIWPCPKPTFWPCVARSR